eukprot:3153461-Amphidinium_carterae.1
MSHAESHMVYAISIEANRSKVEKKQEKPPTWMGWSQRLKHPVGPPPAAQWKGIGDQDHDSASSKSPRRAWRKDSPQRRQTPEGEDAQMGEDAALDLEEQQQKWSFEVEAHESTAATSTAAASEPQGKRTKREPTRMEKMETQLADLSSKLEQMMYGLTVIHQRFEQQPGVQAPHQPQQQMQQHMQQQQHANLPDMSGGGRGKSKVTPAALAAVQGLEPDELLHLHEDEYTCTTEVPKLHTAAGIASITTVNVTSLRQQSAVGGSGSAEFRYCLYYRSSP